MPKHSKPSKARSNIAKNIRYARNTKNWSQEELAHKASLNRNFIGMVERQECAINVDTLSDLARAFGLEPWVLLQPPATAHPQILSVLEAKGN